MKKYTILIDQLGAEPTVIFGELTGIGDPEQVRPVWPVDPPSLAHCYGFLAWLYDRRAEWSEWGAIAVGGGHLALDECLRSQAAIDPVKVVSAWAMTEGTEPNALQIWALTGEQAGYLLFEHRFESAEREECFRRNCLRNFVSNLAEIAYEAWSFGENRAHELMEKLADADCVRI